MDLANGHTKSRAFGERRIPNFRLRSDPKTLAAAALEQFSTTSFAETRIEDITRRLGLSKSALYLHFPSKRGLFDRVIEEFCLGGEQENREPGLPFEGMLASEPAIRVLRIVLREWLNVPGVGAQYLEAVAIKLMSHQGIPDLESARRLASWALAPVTMGILFSADPPNVRET